MYAFLESFKMEEESSSCSCSDEENSRMEGAIVKRRRRESKFCDHCKQFVSKSTFYRHCPPLLLPPFTAIIMEFRIRLKLAAL